MATPTTCVKLKCEVEDIFDKALKPDVLEQTKKTLQTLIDGTKGLKFDPKCKDGWELTTTVSVKVDDPQKPDTIEAKVAINGIHLQGSLKVAKASGNRKVSGINPRKLKEEATDVVRVILEDLMKKRVLPQLAP
jgi:hypothetical protein